MEAVAVGGVGADRRRPDPAVLPRVPHGELALPDVAAVLAVGSQRVAPRVAPALESAPGRALPLGLRRQPHAGPGAVGDGVVPRDVDHGVVGPLVHPAAGAFGLAPRRAVHLAPPRGDRHGAVGLRVGQEVLEDEGPAEALGLGHVASRGDELREVGVGDGVLVDGVLGKAHRAHGALAVGREALAVRAHEERARRDVDEAVRVVVVRVVAVRVAVARMVVAPVAVARFAVARGRADMRAG